MKSKPPLRPLPFFCHTRDMNQLLSVNELPLLVTLLQQADPSLDEIAARVSAAFAATPAQLTFTLLHLNSGVPVGIYARLTSLFVLCRTALVESQPTLLAYLLQLRSQSSSVPLPLPPNTLIASAPHTLFPDMCTAFPFLLPATMGWTDPQSTELTSLDDVIVSAMLHPRTSQDIGRMSARNLALLLATAFAPPPLPPPPGVDVVTASIAYTSARVQHANATRAAHSVLALSESERNWLSAQCVAPSFDTSPPPFSPLIAAPISTSLGNTISAPAALAINTPVSSAADQAPVSLFAGFQSQKSKSSPSGLSKNSPSRSAALPIIAEPVAPLSLFASFQSNSSTPESSAAQQPAAPAAPVQSTDGFELAVARELLVRSFQSSLTAQQLQILVRRLDSDAAFMRQVCDGGDFLPARLSELIECNPMFAVDVLSRILTANGPRVNEYLQAILATSLSLHSLDVVNRLLSLSNGNHSASTKSLLSPEFLAQFISHCLQACDSAKDKYMQARLVRLVCVFVQALLRNDQHAALQDNVALRAELQSFCVTHARVREAAALFRLLKLEQKH